ncbi:MAG: hypothetical protein JSW35_02220 [Deltaproteobacteria bacterium]|nr:MAG: hypothetical protein JSW35_02220 [Deltaproteobacteria bacterium]
MIFVNSKLFSLGLILFVLLAWSLPSLAADPQEIQGLEKRIDNLERTLRDSIKDHDEELRVLEQRLDRIVQIVERHERRINELYGQPSSGPLPGPSVRRPPQRGYIY